MNKTFKALLAGSTVAIAALFIPACSAGVLETPDGVSIDDFYKMTWDDVDNARGYTICIEDTEGQVVEEETRRAVYSLASLEEGDYEIKIMAVGGDSGYSDSGWSQTYYFHRDHENGCIYELINNDSEYQVGGYGTSAGTVTVGGLYRGKPVTRIDESAFRNSRNLENIIILDSVTYIGDNAFFNCNNLLSATLPESVTFIGSAAFQACTNLSSITIPSQIKTLSGNLFNYCRALSSVTLPDIVEIGEYAFANCSAMTSFDIPDSVQVIGERAFYGASSIKSLTLDGSLTSAGTYSFAKMESLEKVEIGENVEQFGAYAFTGCPALREVVFSENSHLKALSSSMFSGCTSLESINLPEGLETIGYTAFYGCESLDEDGVTIPESVTTIEREAFTATGIYNQAVAQEGERYIYLDDWLLDVVPLVAEGVITAGAASIGANYIASDPDFVPMRDDIVGIANYCFNTCNSLSYAILPDSVKYLGTGAFYMCEGLRMFQITEYSDLVSIGDMAFKNCTYLDRVIIRDNVEGGGLKSIGDSAFYGCTQLNNPVDGGTLVPDSVEHIGINAFYDTTLYYKYDEYGVAYAGNWVVGYENGMYNAMYVYGTQHGEENVASYLQYASKVTYIKLKDDVRGIADYALYGHFNLEQLDGMSYVRYIGEAAFYCCSRLGSISLNGDITEIKDYTFYNCSSIDDADLSSPWELASIGRSAFYGCTSLVNISMRDSVTEIGDFAFFGDISVRTVDLSSSLTYLGSYAFGNNTLLGEITIPDGITEIKDGTFMGCTYMEEVNFSQSLKEIGDYSFWRCSSLGSVIIPDSVTTIGNNAFYACSSVNKLDIGSGVKSIGDYAFARMNSLADLVIPEGVVSIGNFAFRSCESLRSVIIPSSVTVIGNHAFYGCTKASIYAEGSNSSAGWSETWNSLRLPVVMGCEISEDGYVVSLTISENSFLYVNVMVLLGSPEREGYEFLGWSTTEGSTEAGIDTGLISFLPYGTKIYAVWSPISA